MKAKVLSQERAGTSRTSVSETGHAKNIANFETEIAFCIGYGAEYNPANVDLKIASLQTKSEAAKIKLRTVKDTKEPFDSVTGARHITFIPLRPFVTRVLNALIALDAPPTVIKDAKTLARKINGKRASNKTETEQNSTISVSQQSYDRLADTFEQLIVLLQNASAYNPNETDLQITALQTVLDSLNAANTAVRNASVPYSNAIIARNVELYAPETGLVEIAQDVKKYVKSVYGATSPQYRQISGIVFRKPVE